jgi:hypothetical protein
VIPDYRDRFCAIGVAKGTNLFFARLTKEDPSKTNGFLTDADRPTARLLGQRRRRGFMRPWS